jgi:hypothetical protein
MAGQLTPTLSVAAGGGLLGQIAYHARQNRDVRTAAKCRLAPFRRLIKLM